MPLKMSTLVLNNILNKYHLRWNFMLPHGLIPAFSYPINKSSIQTSNIFMKLRKGASTLEPLLHKLKALVTMEKLWELDSWHCPHNGVFSKVSTPNLTYLSLVLSLLRKAAIQLTNLCLGTTHLAKHSYTIEENLHEAEAFYQLRQYCIPNWFAKYAYPDSSKSPQLCEYVL